MGAAAEGEVAVPVQVQHDEQTRGLGVVEGGTDPGHLGRGEGAEGIRSAASPVDREADQLDAATGQELVALRGLVGVVWPYRPGLAPPSCC